MVRVESKGPPEPLVMTKTCPKTRHEPIIVVTVTKRMVCFRPGMVMSLEE